MKKLLTTALSVLLLAALVLPQSKLGGTATLGGTTKVGVSSGGGPALRAVVLNGTNQNGHVTLPNASPFTSMGAFQLVYRVRSPANDNGFLVQLRNSAESPQFDVTYDGTNSRWTFSDNRDGVQMFLTPTTVSDSLYKLQYDPSNSRWTWESWNNDGSGRVQTTVAITTTTNWTAFGGGLFTIGSNYYDSGFLAAHLDFFRWVSQVDALNSGCPPATAAVGPTYHARWEFEDNGTDSAGIAGNITLSNSPTYEDSPTQTCP